jgi:CubicO group peptidase (beta-lactamase class C family)
VITDALDMQGVTKYFPPGQIEVMALQAGNDILLLPQDAHKAVKSIREAADSGLISWQLVESKCRALLELKYDLGLSQNKPVVTDRLTSDLNPREAVVLNEILFRSAVTIVKNDYRLLPLALLDRRRIACVSAGDTVPTEFQERLSVYLPCTNITVRPDAKKTDLDTLLAKLKEYDLVLLGVHHANLYPKDHYGMTDAFLAFLDAVPKQNRSILALFGNPYILDILNDPGAFGAIVTTYQDRPETEEAAAEVIAGGLGAQGSFPVSAGGFKAGTGLTTEPARIGFTSPETFGITPEMLRKADSIAADGIAAGAYPGCQVLFAKDGKVFYYKAFGHPEYSDTVCVKTNDLYDLASVTKMAGTTLAVMKLYDEGRIRLDEPIGSYLPVLRNTNRGDLTLREIMSHQAGLQAWIPFFQATLRNGSPDTAVCSSHPSPEFPVRVAPGLFIRADYRDTIIQQIIRSEPGKRGEYKYSDLGFYLLDALVSHLTGIPLDEYLDETFYRPLGLTTMGYRPLLRFPADRIMPTEHDTVWRHALLRGDVHDPGAAMLGGVAGHAGLFSDAFDLAVILQMLLNYGDYGGKQYLMPSTVREFTAIQYPSAGNRRGLGFDKPQPVYMPDGPSCRSASPSSFGHSGFTGTYAWADPENRLIYVFLSNRVCPDASNNKLSQKNIRTDLHQAVYDLLETVSGK